MTEQSALERDFVRLNLANYVPRPYSPSMNKKIAPVVPPKPRKFAASAAVTGNGVVADMSMSTTTIDSDIGGACGNGSSGQMSSNIRHISSEDISSVNFSDQQQQQQGVTSNGLLSHDKPPRKYVSYHQAFVQQQQQQQPPPVVQQVGANNINNMKSSNGAPSMESSTTTAAAAFGTTVRGNSLAVGSAALRPDSPRTPTTATSTSAAVAAAVAKQSQSQSTYVNDPNYVNTANYSNPSNYSNSSNYSNASNYSNMANYSDSSNYSNSSNYSDFSNYDQCYHPPADMKSHGLTSYGAFTPTPPEDDLPPPPPPEPSSYTPLTNQQFPPPPPEDFPPPPPSPVSSSYSELRRAANQAENYANYGPVSESSTYESIYEPIHPRPQSQMSNRSLYSTGSSLYTPYGGSGGGGGGGSGGANKSKLQSGGAAVHSQSRPTTKSGSTGSGTGSGQTGTSGKEDQVDVLTSLLVRSMEHSGDPDFFGICGKCGEKVTSEQNGCTAMEQVFHVNCFTCFVCQTPLQGKPFYAMDGKPYCEEDYLNTLEKCSVCTEPILDRILRATGKPYHPKCFTCVVCGKSLDGIPFTVDAANQIHCIEDFHKKFAPRCCVCKQPIMPEPGKDETVRVVALDKSFHVDCYKCEDCGLILSSEAEGRGCYPLDDHILCKSCNAKRVQLLTSHMGSEL